MYSLDGASMLTCLRLLSHFCREEHSFVVQRCCAAMRRLLQSTGQTLNFSVFPLFLSDFGRMIVLKKVAHQGLLERTGHVQDTKGL